MGWRNLWRVAHSVVEYGNQHVEVSEKLGETNPGFERHRVVRGFSPLGEGVVELVGVDFDLVSQGLEQRADELRAVAARQGAEPSLERGVLAANRSRYKRGCRIGLRTDGPSWCCAAPVPLTFPANESQRRRPGT